MSEWYRPENEWTARGIMLVSEEKRDYESAALAALAAADGAANQNDVASYERQAQVYASLHHASVVQRIAWEATL